MGMIFHFVKQIDQLYFLNIKPFDIIFAQDVNEVNFAESQHNEIYIYLIGASKTHKGGAWGVDDFCAMQHKI